MITLAYFPRTVLKNTWGANSALIGNGMDSCSSISLKMLRSKLKDGISTSPGFAPKFLFESNWREFPDPDASAVGAAA